MQNQEQLTTRAQVVSYDLNVLQKEMTKSVQEMDMPLYSALRNLQHKIDSVLTLDKDIQDKSDLRERDRHRETMKQLLQAVNENQ